MTIEEITQALATVAENQARHGELHARHSAHMAEMERMQAAHSADIAEIDKQIAAVIESQNRHDRQLQRLFDVMDDLADKHLENEGRFASLAESQRRLEGSYDLLESFVTEFRNDTRDYFAQTDSKLATLAGVQAATSDLLAAFVTETNGRFAETDKRMAEFITETNGRFAETDKRMAEFITETNGRFAETDKRMAEFITETNGRF